LLDEIVLPTELERRVILVAGHFLSRERPDAVITAVRDLLA
jgi:hypothetical protein